MSKYAIAALSALLLVAIVGACSAAAHISSLQPPSLNGYHQHRAAPLTFHTVPQPRVQLGINVDFYAYPGENVGDIARTDVAYVKRLHANAMSVSFPFFEAAFNSSMIIPNAATPTPADLTILASVAEQAGLFFSIRPLLDSGSIGGQSRTNWAPPRMRLWFANYQRFLLPYAEMAQKALIPELITGAEFTRFQASPYWVQLDSSLSAVFNGALAYSNNWYTQPNEPAQAIRSVRELVDAYHPVEVGQGASVAQLTAGWDSYLRTLPAGTVLAEVGIAAQPGAYTAPFDVQWPGRPIVPVIQSRWFTAACNSAVDVNLGGIYYWPMTFGQSLTVPPDTSNPSAFVDTIGASAISACFGRLAGASG